MEEDQLLRIGEAIKPLLEALPAVPMYQRHRFSFDVCQNSQRVQVAKVCFAPLAQPFAPSASEKT